MGLGAVGALRLEVLAPSPLSLTGSTVVLGGTMLAGAQLTGYRSLTVTIEVTVSLASCTLGSRRCRVKLLYSYANTGDVKPMAYRPSRLCFGRKGNYY